MLLLVLEGFVASFSESLNFAFQASRTEVLNYPQSLEVPGRILNTTRLLPLESFVIQYAVITAHFML